MAWSLTPYHLEAEARKWATYAINYQIPAVLTVITMSYLHRVPTICHHPQATSDHVPKAPPITVDEVHVAVLTALTFVFEGLRHLSKGPHIPNSTGRMGVA